MSESLFQGVSIVSGGKECSIHLFVRVHVKNQFCSDWLNLTLAQVNKSPQANVFPAGKANLVKLCIGLQKGTVPRPRLLGRALIWPDHFGATTFGLFGLYPSSLSKSAGFVSLAGKVSLVSISYAKSYFYTILACLFTVEV